jgi:protein subunit release factor B
MVIFSMKEKLFSVTASDCDFKPYRGSGSGGQKKNKTESAMRCVHRASGAVGESEDSRKQSENKKIAFKRMSETPEFKKWLDLEVKKKSGQLAIIEQEIEQSLKRTKVEVKEDGKWVDAKGKTFA